MKEAVLDAMSGKTTYRSFFEPWRKKVMVASYRPVGADSDWTVFCMAPHAEYFGEIKTMTISMSVIILVVLIAATILSAVIITISLKPLKTVEVSITEIASGNADLTKRIAVTSNDEIGNVVNGFNKRAERLAWFVTCKLPMTAHDDRHLAAVGKVLPHLRDVLDILVVGKRRVGNDFVVHSYLCLHKVVAQ